MGLLTNSRVKLCSGCGETKLVNEFAKNCSKADGLQTVCKLCKKRYDNEWYKNNHSAAVQTRMAWKEKNRERERELSRRSYRKVKYGLTDEDYQRLLNTHKCCVICEREFDNELRPVIDHDHTSGKVRSLLCNSCNTLLGHARENEGVLLSAIEYLRKHQNS
jgi:hypothetical protein